mmetsp:Transcript_10431/g.19481  ORF Transcript_10431/g.19481 Transcript_10431/m.19481 type:complete len:1131 (+) Transcript_10431:385-3777(+)|eukprot:CAMPEP_0203749910 /NCGR_PEP_ID=MMETSP0098-20131031/4275_1 /ASSEMBLY_ACC=CAM_ASM_000208 /TAXON_ID=96639 /ORGANISM=" , Strain NY0313808BC1" /LENGTH=1130 /DNA_ID=CAMNT_0050639029 /DNA_START=214 /DNA_END=3606 /DNA_ORIENTATION=+
MEKLKEIEQAIELSYQLIQPHSGDVEKQQLKSKVTQYLVELERSDEAWKYGLELFLNSNGEIVRFYGLARIVDVLNEDKKFAILSREDRLLLRESIMGWIDRNVMTLGQEKSYVRNKVAVVLSLLLKREYPENWPDAFAWFLAFANKHRDGAFLFLKILEYVTEEIVAFNGNRSAEEIRHNMCIKDEMRKTTLNDIVLFWHTLLTNYNQTDTELIQLCLHVVEEYIGWIELELIVNDKFIPLLYHLLTETTLFRVHSLKCILEIIKKGMDHGRKVELIVNLDILAVLKRECEKNSAQPDSDSDDGDEDEGWGFRENIAIVLNEIGLRLIEARTGLPRDSTHHRIVLEMLSNQVIPLVLQQCLARNEIEAQEGVLDFVNKMFSIIRENLELGLGQGSNALAVRHPNTGGKMINMPPRDPDVELDQIFRKALPEMLPLILQRMVYPPGFTFSVYDEEEAEFEQHRQLLRKIFINITRCAAIDTVLPFLRTVAAETLNPATISSRPPFEIEVALTLLYAFGEGAPTGVTTTTSRTLLQMAQLGNNHRPGKKLVKTAAKSNPNDERKAAEEDARRANAMEIFNGLIAATHRCGLSQHPEPRVVLIYNSCSTRYAGVLLLQYKDLLGPVIEGLVGSGGIKHADMTVRSQACYLLPRAVNVVITELKPFAPELLLVLKEYLMVSFEAVVASTLQEEEQNNPGEYPKQASAITQPMYTVEDTMGLFECASILIGALDKDKASDPSKIKELLGIAMGQVHSGLEQAVHELEQLGSVAQLTEEQNRRQLLLGNLAAECIRAISLLTKAFTSKSSAFVGDSFKGSLDIALRGLGYVPNHDMLRSRIITMLHCLVRCLGKDCLRFTPGIAAKFLEQSNSLQHLLEAVQFINYLIATFKLDLASTMDAMFLPIVRHVVSVLNSVPDPFQIGSPASTPKSDGGGSQVQPSHMGVTTSTEQVEYRSVKRVLFSFFSNVVESKLDIVMYSPTNLPHLPSVLQLVSDAISSFPDASTQKLCVKALISLCKSWLVQENSPGLDASTRNMFVVYLCDTATVASFRATSIPGFSISDIECVQTLDKICSFHQTLGRLIGQHWYQYLVDKALPSISCPHQLAVEYAEKVANEKLTAKQLRNEFKRILLQQ